MNSAVYSFDYQYPNAKKKNVNLAHFVIFQQNKNFCKLKHLNDMIPVLLTYFI